MLRQQRLLLPPRDGMVDGLLQSSTLVSGRAGCSSDVAGASQGWQLEHDSYEVAVLVVSSRSREWYL